MGKMKMNIKSFLLVLFVFLRMQTNAQKSFTKELEWESYDSIDETILQDTSQIIEWGTNIAVQSVSYKSKHIYVKDFNFFILVVDVCSGIYCPIISVFKNEDNHWYLITRSHANLTEQVEIVVDNYQEKIIFKTKSGQIGELPLDVLD